MASAVEVVADAERIAVAQVALDVQIRLLRIGIDKILGLRITERLESQRKGGPAKLRRRIGQKVLVGKQDLGLVQGLELLLVRLVIKLAHRHAIRVRKSSGENTGPIEIPRTIGSGGGVAGAASGKPQLAAGWSLL